ncbi:MAG: futalosine hydrolase [Bacteroidota bacterium]
MTRLLLVAATRAEIEPTVAFLLNAWNSPQSGRTDGTNAPTNQLPAHYQYGDIQLDLLLSGVGLPATAFALGHVLAKDQYALAIQAGIAGAIDKSLKLGQLVQIESERFADLGAETADGDFIDLQNMGFLPQGPDSPFEADGRILAAPNSAPRLPNVLVCPAISVNKVHGEEHTIAALKKRYPQAAIESMEGAAFFYACRMRQQSCLQLRAISNYVEARDRSKWEIGLAVTKLNELLISLLQGYMAAVD